MRATTASASLTTTTTAGRRSRASCRSLLPRTAAQEDDPTLSLTPNPTLSPTVTLTLTFTLTLTPTQALTLTLTLTPCPVACGARCSSTITSDGALFTWGQHQPANSPTQLEKSWVNRHGATACGRGARAVAFGGSAAREMRRRLGRHSPGGLPMRSHRLARSRESPGPRPRPQASAPARLPATLPLLPHGAAAAAPESWSEPHPWIAPASRPPHRAGAHALLLSARDGGESGGGGVVWSWGYNESHQLGWPAAAGSERAAAARRSGFQKPCQPLELGGDAVANPNSNPRPSPSPSL